MTKAANATSTQDIATVLQKMVVSTSDDTLTAASITATERKLAKLDSDHFFPLENVDGQMEELRAKIVSDRMRLKMKKAGYPELDYSFLSWRKKTDGFPAFIVLTLESNIFKITAEAEMSSVDGIEDVTWQIEPELPEAISTLYEEAIVALGNLSSDKFEDEEIALEAEFHGVIPASVRKAIKKALDQNTFDQIFVICDAPAWSVKKTGRTSKGDPLVVGWDEESKTMYLIASFDTTSLEDYVLTQFKK